MPTANYSITPGDGWVALTSAATNFVQIKAVPENQRIFVTTATSTPAVSSTNATGRITFSGQPTATQTVTVGAVTFTFVAAVVLANDVLIGASAEATLDNLLAKITANQPLVVASKNGTTIIDLVAATAGTGGNSIVLTETATNVAVNGSGTLSGAVTGVQGFLVDDEGFFCDVATTDKYYVRALNPNEGALIRVDVFYILS